MPQQSDRTPSARPGALLRFDQPAAQTTAVPVQSHRQASGFRLALANGLMVLGLSLLPALSACTLTPVYGDHGVTAEATKLSFAAPRSRLEQVVYQELALRFGTSDAPDTPQVSLTVTSSTRVVAQSVTLDPAVPGIATVTGTITIRRGGRIVLTATRQASQTFTNDGQALANSVAQSDAAERAARGLAESLRLTILGALAGPELGQ